MGVWELDSSYDLQNQNELNLQLTRIRLSENIF